MSERTGTRQFRLVTVRHGRRSKRWRWAIEEHDSLNGWVLPLYRNQGYAWTLRGAMAQAASAVKGHFWFAENTTRVEALFTQAYSYTPTARKHSPLPAEFVGAEQ